MSDSKPTELREDEPLSETNVLVGSRLDIADLTRQLVDSTASFAVLCSPRVQRPLPILWAKQE